MKQLIEEWIEHNQNEFNKTMETIDSCEINIQGKVYTINVSPYLRQSNLKEAAGYLKEEIHFRQVELIEKYCLCTRQ